MDEEVWEYIWNFPDYMVSTYGRVARLNGYVMRTSLTKYGDVKLSLWQEGVRRTVSVKVLVADTFVPEKSQIFDAVICKDNDRTNLRVENLLWRPRWFAWKYRHQFGEVYPPHYYTLPVMNTELGIEYKSIVEAATAEGCLFIEVFRSCYSGDSIFPYWHTYVIL